MHRLHTLLVTAYLIGGLALMAQSWTNVTGSVTGGGSTLAIHSANIEMLRGSAGESILLSEQAVTAARQAAAAKNFVIGVLLFALGGFMHAYHTVCNERPVHITVKKKKPTLLYWLEMKV